MENHVVIPINLDRVHVSSLNPFLGGGLYEGRSESKERLHIQPAQLFNFS